MANRKRITKRLVDTLPPGGIIWDSEVRGFGIRCQTAKKVYILKVRISGRQRWLTIGEQGSPWTAETARKEAQRLWGLIRSGVDPTHERKALRNRPTMADLCNRYLIEHAEEHKKPSSVRMDRRNIANHILPLMGRDLVADIRKPDIETFKRAVRSGKTAARSRSKDDYKGGATVTGGPGVANRCLSLLSKMFNLAEEWEMRPPGTNPTRQVKRYAERKFERYLSAEELARLGQEIDNYVTSGGNLYVAAALRLLIFTGARLDEILQLSWRAVDLKAKVLRLEDSKTGPKSIFLNPPALQLLSELPHIEGNDFVIPGRKNGRPLVNLRKPWGKIRSGAGLSDVRIHDLRHSFASVAVSSGYSLPLIGKLLGHRRSVTTERYAHLAQDPIVAANDLVGKRIDEAMRQRHQRGQRQSVAGE